MTERLVSEAIGPMRRQAAPQGDRQTDGMERVAKGPEARTWLRSAEAWRGGCAVSHGRGDPVVAC
jgi:hypothetical protein